MDAQRFGVLVHHGAGQQLVVLVDCHFIAVHIAICREAEGQLIGAAVDQADVVHHVNHAGEGQCRRGNRALLLLDRLGGFTVSRGGLFALFRGLGFSRGGLFALFRGLGFSRGGLLTLLWFSSIGRGGLFALLDIHGSRSFEGRFGRGRGLRRGFGGGGGRGHRRRVGAGQLHHGQREPQELHTGVVDGAVGGDGVHKDCVLLALVDGSGADGGLLVGGVGAQEDVVALVADLPVVAGHVAIRLPVEHDVAGLHIADAVLHAGHRLHADLRVADGADFRHNGNLDPLEGCGCVGDVLFVVIHGIGGDFNGVQHIVGQSGDGHARVGQHGLLIQDDIAVLVIDHHIVVLDVAFGEPAEGDIAAGGAVVADTIGIVLNAIIVIQRDHRIADHRRGNVDGGIRIKQQLLGAHGGHAGGLQADLALEQRHGLLGGLAEVSVHLVVVVAQFLEAALQALHAAVPVAAAQGDVAGGLGSVMGKQCLQHRNGGLAGLPQAGRPLEHAHRGGGLGGIAAAHVALQIVQLAQAIVQLAHAVACVAGIQVYITGTAARAVGIQQLQRLAGGLVADVQAVFLLEQLHGLLGARTEDAVGSIGQVTQVAQAFLHPGDAHAPLAAGQLHVGVVGLQRAGEDGALQIRVGHAVHSQAQVILQHADGVLGAGTEDAVHVIIIITQVVKGLLDGANGVAAAAPGQRGVLLDGLQLIPGGGLAGHGQLVDQLQHGIGHFRLCFKLDE